MTPLSIITIAISQFMLWPGAYLLQSGARRQAPVDILTGFVCLIVGFVLLTWGLSFWSLAYA